MRKLVISLVALAVLVSAVSAANAQWFNVSNPKPNSVKAGIFWPSDGDLRDETSSIWWQAAYERVLSEMPESNSDVTLEFAWTQNSSGDIDVRIAPLTLNWRQHSVPASDGGGVFYWGAGLGPAFIKAEFDYMPPASSVELAQFDGDGDESTTRMSYSAFVGQNYENWLWEVKYRYISLAGENAGGIFGSVGIRF